MPCNVCENIFKVRPCETTGVTLSVQSGLESLGSKYITKLYQEYLLPYINSVYKDLTLFCPCKECLVRSACINGASCDQYTELMNRSKPIFNRLHFPSENEIETEIKEDIDDKK